MDPSAQRVGEIASEATLATTQFRRDAGSGGGSSGGGGPSGGSPSGGSPSGNGQNGSTTVFERSRALGAVGDYDLVQQLSGSVFVGQHRATKQPFAIRLLEPAGRTDQLARQLAAARALTAIDHPNVVRTLEVGLHEGRVFLVMEYLRGTSLGSWLDVHGAPPVAQALRIGMHVARGLDALHQRGILHRNVDADTVMIVPSPTGKNTIKLVDIEIAPREELVRTARHSMSPELVRGGTIDHRSDLYSLGVLLYRACTLKYPFEGSPIEILAMYRFRSVMRPEPSLEGVPVELAATVQRLLSEDPAERQRSAADVVEALRRATDGSVRRDRRETPGRPGLALDADQIPTEQRGSLGSAPVAMSAPAPSPAKALYAAVTAAASAKTLYAPVPATPAAPAAPVMAAPASARSLYAPASAVSAAPVAAAMSAPVSAASPANARMVAPPAALTLLAAPKAAAPAPAPAPISAAAAASPASPTLVASPRALASSVPAGHASAAPAAHARAIVLPRAPVSLASAGPAPAYAYAAGPSPAYAAGPSPAPAYAAGPSPAPAYAAGPSPAPAYAAARASAAPAPALPVPVPAPVLSAPAFAAPRAFDPPAPAKPAPAASSSAVPEPIGGSADSSGVLLAPSGPARVATALSLEPASSRADQPRRRIPWKPAAVLGAAVVLGSVLSLFTMGGGDGDKAPAVASASPAPAPRAPAAAAPAAVPASPAAGSPSLTFAVAASPAATLAAAAAQPIPGCAPALVPDVVLAADPASSSASGAGARAAQVREEPKKPVQRKPKPRKVKPPEDTDAPEPARARADEEPVSGETLIVPDEEPRKPARRADREDRADRTDRADREDRADRTDRADRADRAEP
ncbi:MAG TPA: protein kinase [Kofleriaceae bacterium]|nr:protein kinase [Kofleriaceae bacterium]